ncbi:alpha/beta fold hydrolase [Azospirillum sp. SYSU D00513]|uniref:alpha/beta fold hydrolase n=1 Tax=Azospirillum sp. SYSU D00513 TaxID=2812561 RepID=UPI001A967549|nr:alpha/beta fold hydrolase [Azospirillum sp. SYSU D00513]
MSAARMGPRPLPLHLWAATMALPGSIAALPLWKNGLLPWSPHLRERGQTLRNQALGADADALRRALDREVRARLDLFLTGMERYRRHPYRRALPDPPEVWTEGAARLLDYGPSGPAGERGAGARTVLFVPSLVNRHYILDLSAERSLMRWLAARDVRPLLLDWGTPGPAERRFTLTDLVAGRLERALAAAVERAGGPVAVAGYCMGGLLTTALAQRRPDQVAALVLMATPWDFHTGDGEAARRAAAAFAPFRPLLEGWGEMPADAIQALFTGLDPLLALRKFSRFARLPPDGAEARAFVALEDWLNDGVPLAAAVAREALEGWYGGNGPARGRWLVAGAPVEPRRLALPTLALIPEQDRIVPPASALALARAIPGARTLHPPLGHIGMVVSTRAEEEVWQPLYEWLSSAD